MSKLSQEIKECVSCPQINGKHYGRWGTLNSKQRINIWNLAEQCEMFEEIADKSMEELTKYKMAFEILKDNAQISIKKCLWDGETIYYLVINQEYGDQIQFRLSKEEKELLEELMKGE